MGGINGPFSSSTDERSDLRFVNNAIASDGPVYAPRVAGGGKGSTVSSIANSGPAVTGRNNTVTTTDFGAVAGAIELSQQALASQAALGLEAVGAARDIGLTHVSDGANLNADTTRVALYSFAAVALVGLAIWLILKR